MAIKDGLIAEIKMESASTRKVLERVPTDKPSWKPHDKSMEMGRLATHVADIPSWIALAVNTDELDLSKRDYKPQIFDNNADLVAHLDKNVSDAIAALETASDELLNKPWKLRHGDHVIFELPRHVVIRSVGMNHNYHHRAQLGVYLRLNDVPVPGVYGPSADDAN